MVLHFSSCMAKPFFVIQKEAASCVYVSYCTLCKSIMKPPIYNFLGNIALGPKNYSGLIFSRILRPK